MVGELEEVKERITVGINRIRNIGSERVGLKQQVESLSLELTQKNNDLKKLLADNAEIKKQVEALIAELNSVEFA